MQLDEVPYIDDGPLGAARSEVAAALRRNRLDRRRFTQLAIGGSLAGGLAAINLLGPSKPRRAYAAAYEVWDNCTGYYNASTICVPSTAYYGADTCDSATWHRADTVLNGCTQVRYSHNPVSCNGRNAWIWRTSTTETKCSDGARRVIDCSGQQTAAVFSICRTSTPITPQTSTIGGTVRNGSGIMAGVGVDLYTANADLSRGTYITSAITATDGTYRFTVQPACYVITAIAPTGQTFTNFSQWLNLSTCPTAGQTITNLDATLQSGGTTATVGGIVTRGGAAVAGVSLDLYTTSGNGIRGTYLTSTTTAADGTYRFNVQPACYVITAIAPAGQTFTNGSQWLNQQTCPTAGQTITTVNAALAAATTSTIGGTVRENGTPVAGIDVDLYSADDGGVRGSYLSSAVSAADGTVRFAVPAACYVLTFIAPNGQTFTNGSQWLNLPGCVVSGETLTSLTANLT